MKQPTRQLCQRYTNLTEEEIVFLEEYNPTLQALANAEQADVFIDCQTSTGKCAIIVSEAKPHTVPSSYSKPLIGMLIQWKDEPAVDRSFRLGVATVGMKAVSVPENSQVVQTVEPLYYQEKLVGVLIYEKRRTPSEELLARLPGARSRQFQPEHDWLVEQIQEAVLLVDQRDMVCDCNRAARKLYRELGYVDDLLDMPASNVRLCTGGDPKQIREVRSGSHVLEYQEIPLSHDRVKYSILIRDITERRRQESENQMLTVSLRELKHRVKNNLQLLANLMRCQGQSSSYPEVQDTMYSMSVRLMSIMATLDEMVQRPGEKVSLRSVLEQIRTNCLQNFLMSAQPIVITVSGADQDIPGEAGASVALVVNELVLNAVKHAFPNGRAGHIAIEAEQSGLSFRISVRDDGVGFDPAQTGSGLGLELVQTIVRDRLSGEVTLESGPSGTNVTFDFWIF